MEMYELLKVKTLIEKTVENIKFAIEKELGPLEKYNEMIKREIVITNNCKAYNRLRQSHSEVSDIFEDYPKPIDMKDYTNNNGAI